MAHLVKKDGMALWWPDYYKVDDVQLDPKLTPMQNCWRIIDMQVSVWLNKYKIFAYSEDRMVDLEQSCRVAVYSELLRRVRLGQYDRQWNFWTNVRSCAWSCISRVIKQWRAQDIIHANELDGNELIKDAPSEHSSMTYFDMVATESVPRLITASEFRNYSLTDWRDAKTEASRTNVLNRLAEESYEQYCEDCMEFGLKPVDKVVFLTKSYTDEERQIMLYSASPVNEYARKYRERLKQNDPRYFEKRRAYNKQYYQRHKEEIKAQRKKNAT